MKYPAFAEGPVAPKEVLSLGLYRTGSHSLQEALKILGYQHVFHSSEIAESPDKFPFFTQACLDNIPSLPGFTGNIYGRAEWDECFGPSTALTDLAPFAESLVDSYPEAKVILVTRDFEPWVKSYLDTLVNPSSKGILAWMSGNVWEPVLGLKVSQTVWMMYMGLMGVSRLNRVHDRQVLKAGYDRHYQRLRNRVPKEKLLEIDLKELDWEPLCKFLGKEVPDQPFPRLNESKVFQNKFVKVHVMLMMAGLAKVLGSGAVAAGVAYGAYWLGQKQGYF